VPGTSSASRRPQFATAATSPASPPRSRADLAASARLCTLAFWQDPYFTRTTARHGPEAGVKPWVDALFAANADVLVQASNHDYQRFADQDPNRVAAPGRGLRAFVVGTGGIGLYTFTAGAPNVEASNDTTWGSCG
jgi:alkaline phosphatase